MKPPLDAEGVGQGQVAEAQEEVDLARRVLDGGPYDGVHFVAVRERPVAHADDGRVAEMGVRPEANVLFPNSIMRPRSGSGSRRLRQQSSRKFRLRLPIARYSWPSSPTSGVFACARMASAHRRLILSKSGIRFLRQIFGPVGSSSRVQASRSTSFGRKAVAPGSEPT